MGNQFIKNELRQVMSKDFDDHKLDQYISMLWTFDNQEEFSYKQIDSGILDCSTETLEKQFPTQCSIEKFTKENIGKANPQQYNKDVTYAAGFSTSEKKIDDLRQEDVKLLRVENNPSAIAFEAVMHGKIGILSAMLLARHKGDESIDNFLVHATKTQTGCDAAHSLESVFSTALMCNDETLLFLLKNQPAYISGILEAMLEQARHVELGKLCETQSIREMDKDLRMKQMRHILKTMIKSDVTETALKTLAVRLLLRLGFVYATAEDMLLAAELQVEYNLDISYELMPLLDKSEAMRAYVPPAKPDDSSDKWSQSNEITNQSRVSFGSTGDNTQAHDAGTCDSNYYYMFSDQRGLFKGKMDRNGWTWENSSGNSDVKNTYKEVTFVNIDGKVHLRSSHLPDQPFVELDVEKCAVKEDYQPWTSQDNLLNWTDKESTEVQGSETDGYRYLRPTQMHYLNNELWIVVPYYEKNYDSPIKRLVVEVYTREGRHFTRTQEIPLFKEDGIKAFQGAKRRATSYLDRGMLHKNAKFIVWHAGKYIHVFDRVTGQRIQKRHWNSTQHVVFWNPTSKHFHWMDCACYSYNYLVKITGYDPEDQIVAEAARDAPIPVCLDEIKQNIKLELMSANEEELKVPVEESKEGDQQTEVTKVQKKRDRPTVSNIRRLMDIADQPAKALDAVPAVSTVEDIHKKARAIIYSFVGVEANYAMKAAQFRMEHPPFGDDMTPFFKAKFSIYLNRDFIMMCTSQLIESLQLTQGEQPNLLEQVRLFTLMHLALGTFYSLKCCRMQAQQILNTSDIAIFQQLIPKLQVMKPMESTVDQDVENLSKESLMNLNILKIAKDLYKTLLSTLDSLSAFDKLDRISIQLNTKMPQTAQSLMVQLATKDELSDLFQDTGKLKGLLPALNGCCFVINQSLKRVLSKAISEKQFATDLDNEFCQAASNLQSMICQELCASYGDQLLAIMDNKDKAQGTKPESMNEEEWNKIQNKYNGAVENLKNLDQYLYQAFINISEHIKFQMNQLTKLVDEMDTTGMTDADFVSLANCCKDLFSRDASILRSSMLFCLTFASFEVDVTWLDEIAEGLKHITTAINSAIFSFNINLESKPFVELEENQFVIYLKSVLRQISYTIGWVAGRFIQQNDEENDTLNKLNILQGGVENRFIPALSELTKIQIEGSFKITGDKKLQNLALQDANTVIFDAEDQMLKDIIDNGESVKLTLDVLQQALLTKIPFCPFARLGGQSGSDISRAAFSVIIKFTESTSTFQELNNQITQIAKEVGSSGTQQLKDTIIKIKEQNSGSFDALLKRWETASQMRKWTQQIKLTISERTAAEAEEAFRQEYNTAHPSADPLTGQLSQEQKSVVEDKSNLKFDEELKKTYEGVVAKARSLIKLQLPAAFKSKKPAKGIMASLQSQMSLKVQEKLEESKKLHIMIEHDQDKKDKEYDWTDRLKQWKKVQMAEGAIVNLGAKGQLNSQSASIAILGLLQSEYTNDQINSTVEKGLINGLRRMAGLNLIHHGLSLTSSSDVFFDMIQWFSANLRQRKNTSAHYLDGLAGCGISCEAGIRSQFFKILSKVTLMLKTSTDRNELKLLLNVLCWNYKTEDHEDLGKLDIFKLLSKGDGTDLSWVNYCMGNYMKHQHSEAFFENWDADYRTLQELNLGRCLQQTTEYIQNQVLVGVIGTDTEVAVIESTQSQSKMLQAQTLLDGAATDTLMTQLTDSIWHNLNRSLTINRLVPAVVRREENFINRWGLEMIINPYKEADYQEDKTVFADCLAKIPNIKTQNDLKKALKKRKMMLSYKMSMLIQKITKEQKEEGVSDVLMTFLQNKVGPALGIKNVGQIIEAIKSRDLIVQELLQRSSFEDIGMLEPQPVIEKEHWKNLVHETSIEGATHGDTDTNYDQVQWLKDQFDDDTLPQIRSVDLYQDTSMCFGFQFYYQNDVVGQKFCGSHAPSDVECTNHALAEDEYITKVDLRTGSWCDRICLITNKGRELTAGGMGGGPVSFNLEENAERPQLLAFGAGVGGHIHHLKCFYVDHHNQGEEEKEENKKEGEDQVIEQTEEQKCSEILKQIGQANENLYKRAYKNKSPKVPVIDTDANGSFFGFVPQFRILMQLDQLISISEKSALVNSLIQDCMHPQKLQNLIEVAAQSHPNVQQLVQRIFQILLKMDVPCEIFESAIEASPKFDTRGLPTRLNKLLAKQGVLTFSDSKFLQMLCNLVQETCEKVTERDNGTLMMSWDATVEVTRTLRVLQTNPTKNQALGAQLKTKLKAALLSLETKSDAEVEALFFMMGETRVQNNWTVGQAVQTEDGDFYSILDCPDIDVRACLYFDPTAPQRQEFVSGYSGQSKEKIMPQKLLPILDLLETDTVKAAKNSVLMDPEVISKLIDVANGSEMGVGKLSNLTCRSLQSSISRGLMNQIKTLKLDYLSILTENSLLEKLISYLVLVSGESSFPFDKELRNQVLQDMEVSGWKEQWTNLQFNRRANMEEIKFCENYENEEDGYTQGVFAFQVLQFDTKSNKLQPKTLCDFVKYKSNITTRETKESDQIIISQNIDNMFAQHFTHQNAQRAYPQSISFFISSKQLQDQQFGALHSFSKAGRVYTDDEVPIEEVLTSLKNAVTDKSNVGQFLVSVQLDDYEKCVDQITVLAKADFDRLQSRLPNMFATEYSEEGLDVRSLALNQVMSRLGSDANDVNKLIKGVAKMSEDFDSVNSVLEAMEVRFKDEENQEDALKHIADIKNNIAFVKPVSEGQVEETKELLKNGIANLFKKPVEGLPDFGAMLVSSTEAQNTCQQRIASTKDMKESRYANKSTDEQNQEYREQIKRSGANLLKEDQIASLTSLFLNYKVLNESICRSTLITILESAGDKLNESAQSLLNQEQMTTKLDDLIHNEHMVSSHQAMAHNDKTALARSEEKIKNALKLFVQSPTIKKFLVDDFFKRAKETLEKASKENWTPFLYADPKLVDSFRKEIGLEAILDPMNILLLTKQFLEQGFIEDERLPECLMAFIDLSLVFSLVLQNDDYSLVSMKLMRHVLYLIKQVGDKIALFSGKTEMLTKLLSNDLLKIFMGCITDVNGIKGNPKYQIILEIANQLNDLKQKIQKELDQNIPINLGVPEDMQKIFTAISTLKDGTKFSSRMNKMKFETLKDQGDSQIAHLATSYKTTDKRFTTPLVHKFGPAEEDWTLKLDKMTASDFLQAETSSGAQIMCDKSSFAGGNASKLVIKAGETMTLKFPIKPQMVKWTGVLRTKQCHEDEWNVQLSTHGIIEKTSAISPVQVLGTSNHLTFVGSDGSIYGMGGRIQQYSCQDKSYEAFRKIELPEGLTSADIKKVHVGKFARLIWTHDGRFFHNGQHKYYVWGPTKTGTTEEDTEKFCEMNKDWFRNGDDKIVDWVAGKHYNTVLTESGKMICSGYQFWRKFDSEIRSNDENYEDWPFKVKEPEGFQKAIKAFPSYKIDRVFVNWEKIGGKIRTFMIGGSSDTHSPTWMDTDLPENRYFKKVESCRQMIYGICDQNNLWCWSKDTLNDIYTRVESPEVDCLASHDDKPNKVTWFSDNNLRIIDVKAGMEMAIVLTENSEGNREFYGFGKNIRECSNNNKQVYPARFGENAKTMCPHIYLIVDIDANKIADYAVTYDSVSYLVKGDNKKPISIVPDKPDATGLIHYYKNKEDGNWVFVTEDEYEAKKEDLPRLCFATRASISDFSEKKFVDLEALESQLTFESEGEPSYYAKFTIGASEDETITQVTATEKMALEASQAYDINPVIFIRSSKPATNALDVIQSVKLTDYFQQVEENESIGFTIQKTVITEADLEPIEVRDEASKQFLSDIKDFTPSQDSQLIAQIDQIAKSKGFEAQNVNLRTLDPSTFTWSKETAISKKSDKIIKLRSKLLMSLVKSWRTLGKIIDLNDKEIPGTVSNLLFRTKFLVPPTVLSMIVDQACEEISTGYGPTISVSRRKAMVFADSGKVDHEAKYSMFGQIIKQLAEHYPNMENFKIKSIDEKCYSINFLGEGSIDAGGPFRESLTNIAEEMEKGVVPLLIRSPNNKNEHGINRDCYILDSRSKTPSHKQQFKYFGAFLAYAFLSKSPVPFNLAPWVWKQILHEEVTLQDLDAIDAYSAQVLRDMQQYAQNLSDEDFDAGVDQCFTTVLSSGEEIPLMEDGESVKVTKTNIDDFVAKVLKARSQEATEQIAATREGFLQVIEQKQTILDFLDWQTFENRVTGEKKVSVERLKSITSFPNNGADHEIVARWWRVFESMNDAERTAYLKFVWGRSRLPIDLEHLNYKHQVRLIDGMSKTAFPQAHTCFFQLDVPNYETDELMKQRITVAAELCGEMDTDNNAAEDLD